MTRQHSLEELYRLHEDAGEWAEASRIFLKIMERDHGYMSTLRAMKDDISHRHAMRQRIAYTDAEAESLDREEFEREERMKPGGYLR